MPKWSEVKCEATWRTIVKYTQENKDGLAPHISPFNSSLILERYEKLIAEHEAKLAELDKKLAHIEMLEQQIMQLEAYGSPRGE